MNIKQGETKMEINKLDYIRTIFWIEDCVEEEVIINRLIKLGNTKKEAETMYLMAITELNA